MERYSVVDKSMAELLADLDSQTLQGNVGAGSYELAHTAAVIKAAEANAAAAERSARAAESSAESTRTTARWARIAALGTCASAFVAVAALVVALTG